MVDETQKLISWVAWGDWHKSVPKGMVGVQATPTGRPEKNGRHFLVPAAEYTPHMAIDPERYDEVFDFGGSGVKSPAAAAPASESMQGGARPWGQGFAALNIPTKSAAKAVAKSIPVSGRQRPAAPQETSGAARPWREVLQQIEAEDGPAQ